MEKNNKNNKKKISKGFLVVVIIILLLAIFMWLFWSDIKNLIIASEYEVVVIPANIPVVDIKLKQDVLSDLNEFVQYGRWPIPSVRDNLERGNPFEPKP